MINILKIKISKQFKKVVCVALMGSLCTASILSLKTFARDVYINVDNDTIHSVTLNNDVSTILEKTGIKVSHDDIVEKFENPDGSLKLNIKRALNISVRDDIKQVSIKTASDNVSSAISEAGFKLGEYDITNFDLNSNIKKDMKIVIIRRAKVYISVDGEEKEYLIPQCSVENALNYAGISLGKDDIINFDLNSKLHNDMKIVINRIKYENGTRLESIPRKTIIKKSSILDLGVKQTTEEGKDGKKEVHVRYTLKDNEIVNSEVINSKIIEEPVDRIVLEGTKQHVSEQTYSNSNESNSSNQLQNNNVSKVLYGSATAYTASKGARTSTGKVPIEGETVAVNPKVIPYGSKILVESKDGSFKKTLIAQDTGGALRKGSAIADIYMDSTQSCKSFGRKSVKISILK